MSAYRAVVHPPRIERWLLDRAAGESGLTRAGGEGGGMHLRDDLFVPPSGSGVQLQLL